jgi:hypothetical protein
MKKQYLFLTLAILIFSEFSGLQAQTVTGQGFEGGTFPPAGWSTIGNVGFGAGWSRRTTANAGTTPAATPQAGSAMARFVCRNQASGTTQTLVSPVIDLSKRGSTNSYVSFYMFRDTVYTTDDSLTFLFNTSRSLTGATRIQGIKRYARANYPDSGAHGWYKYSFAIPSNFKGNTNYFMIQGTARGAANAGNIFIDSVTWDAYPTYCEGKPDAGTVTANTYYICGASGPATITLSNYTNTTGISISWQLSTDSSTFNTNAWTTAVNTANFGAAIGTYRYIRAIVTCNQSGEADTSNCIRLWIDNTATPPTITVTPNNGVLCAGSTTPLQFVASGATTYTWTPATGLSAESGDTIYALPSVSTGYAVSGTDDNGCIGTRNFFVQIQNGPNVTITALDTVVCDGDSVQLTANATGTGLTYLWSTGSIIRTSWAKAVGETTTYQVSVKNGAGCETIRTQTVYGVLQPQAAYSYKVVKDRTVEFKFEGTNTANVYWNFSDGNESFQQNTTYTFSADGTYKVMLVANNPPCGSDTIYFDVTVAQSNSSVSKLGLNGLVISPNPTSDLMNVKFSGFEQELRAEILSIDGQVVSVNEFKMLNGNIGFTLNLENLTDGIYILHLRNDSFETVNRIQIQH